MYQGGRRVAMTDRELFARLIRCEAEGEGEAGMKAVATVVMNRVHVSDGEYLRTGQGNLRRVIEQPYQFTCLLTEVYGEVNPQNVYNIPAEQIHYEIADWAMAGIYCLMWLPVCGITTRSARSARIYSQGTAQEAISTGSPSTAFISRHLCIIRLDRCITG